MLLRRTRFHLRFQLSKRTADAEARIARFNHIVDVAVFSSLIGVGEDKPFLQLTQNGVLIHGSPWSGKHGLDTNICVPLKGICLLERGAVNGIRPAAPEQVRDLLKGFRPRTQEQTAAYEALLTQLLERAPLWRMECNKEKEAAAIAHAAMSK